MPDLSINIDNLVGECAQQSQLFYESGVAAITANVNYKRRKLEYEQKRAQRATDIRNNPTDYGIAKITEGAVAEALGTDKDLIEMQESLTNAEEAKMIAENVKDSYLQRASMLKAEVELHIQGLTQPDGETARVALSRSKRDGIVEARKAGKQ